MYLYVLYRSALTHYQANVNATDINGWTPLHVAASTAQFDVCEELLKAKNRDAAIQNKDNSTPFIYLVRLGKNMIKGNYKQYKRVLKMMLECDIDSKILCTL